MRQARTQAVVELVGAGALWGFGFIATIWALTAMGPLALTGWRFFTAAAVGGILCLLRPDWRKHLTREQFWLAAPPGLLLAGLLIFQTWGLRYTTATKSGFITTLYVLMVPILESRWLKRPLKPIHYAAVFLALIGTILICDLPAEWTVTAADASVSAGAVHTPSHHPGAGLNFGDLLTFVCSIFASFQILWFARIDRKISDPFVFNTLQSIWAGAVPLALSFVFEPLPNLSVSPLAWSGFLSLAFGSTLIALALQIRAQKVLSPSVASLLFLLESPFATLFAVSLLGETLKPYQWGGAALILAAAAISTTE